MLYKFVYDMTYKLAYSRCWANVPNPSHENNKFIRAGQSRNPLGKIAGASKSKAMYSLRFCERGLGILPNGLRVCAVFASLTLINTNNERIRTKQSK